MFWERFYSLCQEQSITPTKLVRTLGMAVGLITKWKNGANPTMEALTKISNYFDVSVDYLIGKTDKKRTDTDGLPLTEQQQKLFDAASDLPDEDVRQALDYIELLRLKRNQKPE